MCGICGYMSFSDEALISPETICRMTDAIKHRGPNDSGCALFQAGTDQALTFKEPGGASGCGRVALGHRRLSIIDLSSLGHQPLSSADGNLWLCFNGEIYNYIELRETLESYGCQFRSKTDTEVALQAYKQWGPDCFNRFNGMWSVALYDREKNQIILSRDRFGKKPLYYYKNDRVLVFSSEIKSLFQCAETPRKPNFRKIYNYAGRHYRYVDWDCESFFEEINQVPRSSLMIINADGSTDTRVYWSLHNEPLLTERHSERDLIEILKCLLADAVKIRLRSDVPVGTMLSGGIDSASITCLAANINPGLLTFSSVTGDGDYDESEYIREVTNSANVNAHYIYPQPSSLFSILPEMLDFHDEPVCTPSWLSIYQIIREIAKFKIPVVLTGHGGDELFAGYWDHYHYNFADIRNDTGDDTYEREMWLANHRRNPDEYIRERYYIQKLNQDNAVETEKFSKYTSLLRQELKLKGDRPEFSSPFTGNLSRRLYLEMMCETIPASLRAEDRNCMAFSIENRAPFLDYRLAEFAFRLPNRLKIRDGIGKWILREAMRGILPEKVISRRDKAGHNLPFDRWIRNENRKELENMFENSNSFANRYIYDTPKTKELFKAHLRGENHYMFFWQYINLTIWAAKHFSQ